MSENARIRGRQLHPFLCKLRLQGAPARSVMAYTATGAISVKTHLRLQKQVWPAICTTKLAYASQNVTIIFDSLAANNVSVTGSVKTEGETRVEPTFRCMRVRQVKCALGLSPETHVQWWQKNLYNQKISKSVGSQSFYSITMREMEGIT